MNKLNSIYLFKISLILIIFTFINDYLITLIISIILLNNKIKYYLILIIIFMLSFIFLKVNNYILIDEVTFNNKLSNNYKLNDTYKFGDIVLIYNKNEYKIISNDIKYNVYTYVNEFENDIKPFIYKYLYNQNTYDSIDTFLIGSSLYYILKYIIKLIKKRYVLFIMLLYWFIFGFHIQFYLIFIYMLFDKSDKFKNCFLLVSIIFIINLKLLDSYSILIPILINIFNCFNYKQNIFYFISLFLFNKINFINLIFFKYIKKINICLFIVTISLLIFRFDKLYLLLMSKFMLLLNLIEKYSINGSLSYVSIIIIYIILKLYKIKNRYLIIIFTTLIFISPINNPFISVTFIDVGQGDSILIYDGFKNYATLIDTGSKYNWYKLNKYLKKQGVKKIDNLIITHPDEDHFGNLENLKNNYVVNNIIEDHVDIINKNIELYSLNSNDYLNENDNSLVYFLNINNIKFLFTGDISQNVEKIFIEKYSNFKVDVLKVGHHGSKYSSNINFLKSIEPKFSIISTSGLYNHPHIEVIENLNKIQSNIYNTNTDSSITFTFLPFNICVISNNKNILFYKNNN